MRHLYSALTYLLRPLAFAAVLWRGMRQRGYWSGLGERFGRGTDADSSVADGIWVHAVSLGEVTAAAPLVRALRARYPALPLLLTTATPTGRMRAQSLFAGAVAVRYLPYDTPGSMKRFLRRVRPRIAIIMETELWPNLFHQCRRRGIPVVLANARLAAKSVDRYRRFGALFRAVWSGNTYVAAQTAVDARRFIALGAWAARTQVIGSLKFDIVVDDATLSRGRELRESFGALRPVWIAGSTHAGEEEAALDAHFRLKARIADALLLLVPRHPARFQAVADLMTRQGIRFERRSRRVAVPPDADVLLVDSVGELATLYASVDAAFVGGSLVAVGGHNLLEPAALGIPVITGPYQSNARDVAHLLLREGAALEVTDAATLADVLTELFTDPEKRQRIGMKARDVVAANRGSLQRLLDLIAPLLEMPPAACPHPGAVP